jgi:hypothetical protein
MNKESVTRLNASIPREYTALIKQRAEDLNLTPSNFIALCVESMLEIMDSDNPSLPYFVTQYRFLKSNSQLRSQLQEKRAPLLRKKS